MSVVTNIVPSRFPGDFVSNCPDKISIFPERSTLQFSLHLWISQKDFFRTRSFEHSQNLSNRIFGWNSGNYMDVILGYFHFLYLKVSCFQYLPKELLCSISRLFLQYVLAIFGCPHKVVSTVLDRRAYLFDGHAVYYSDSIHKDNTSLPMFQHRVTRGGFS